MDREDTKQLVRSVIEHFSELGELTSRSMFGGYGICKGKVMFGLVSEDKFYLRANKKLEAVFATYGMNQFVYSKRGIPVLLKYYHVNESLWRSKEALRRFAAEALFAASSEMREKDTQEYVRIKDLPNLNLAIERMLRQAGIKSCEELFSLGAFQSFIKIREMKKGIKSDLLFSLAGAIEGCHVVTLPTALRDDLTEQLKLYDKTKK
ncbi:TfoX/Sxy family DNA transformation protein [Budviciaceae bacterium CWB-B4]|uniref:TfoX/Sxy family DNA transformation protein n=1 Tax=Limnobaculum xujianqingii TaxID=2738837 RepID=A0A9D7FUX0_9GAMM|nr:TfoX/Sxy family DNA transformation protein [Limnobaculum xujianqingii]MBK5073728.1 TfoX/Sxy family DNA transformation protein [Limnobaculum xujianqingii]MBK5177378.1 TfoX/Sxy family DNA transformation protein [Limnobaculum xujianqingii]